jgi:hypothetical protein
MSVNQKSKFERDEQIAAVIASVVAALVGGLFVHGIGGDSSMLWFAYAVGASTVATGWTVWLVSAFILGIGFSFAMARTINKFTNTIIMISRKSRVTQKLLVPILHVTPLGLTAGSMGGIYGQVIGFGVFAWLMPVVLFVNGLEPPMFPLADFAVIGGYFVWGHVLGGVYGGLLEQDWFKFGKNPDEKAGGILGPLSPSREQRAGIVGALVAGLLSGVFIAALVDASVFTWLAEVFGSSGLFTGFLVWLGICVVLGLVFVAYVSRTINDFTSTVIMFSRNSKATQKILVPLITRAALTVTAGSMGLGYGLVIGLVVFAGGVVGVLPALSPLVVVAFVLFGQVLGTTYGLQLEEVNLGLSAAAGAEPSTESEEEPMLPTEQEGFTAWRIRRPFSGGVMLILAGMIILAIPLRMQSIFPGPSKAALGIVFGSMVIACGVFALVKPELSTLIGVTAVAMSILSIIGAFGGLVIGMLVGILGGNLCISWQDPMVTEEEETASGRFKWIGEGERQQW